MRALFKIGAAFKQRLKWLIAGDELAALERYREACDEMLTWKPLDYRCQDTVKFIQRHGEHMTSDIGQALNINIARRLHSLS